MKKQQSNNKGITLIALIISIIILLILAVVSIGAIRESSIITHAQNAKYNYIKAQEEEQIQLALSEWRIQKNIPNNTQTFKSTMESALEKDAKVDGDNNGPLTVTFKKTGNIYEVREDETITEIAQDTRTPEEIELDLKKIILGEDLSGKNLFAIMDTYDEFKNDEIKYVFRTSDRGEEEILIYYIQYKGNFYKFRAISTEDEEYINTDSKYGLKLVEKINENSMVGKKVKFNGTNWTVLYHDETRGLQIISDTCLGNITLGDDNNISNTISAYNESINILNNACENLLKKDGEYISKYISDVRSVGSNPTNKQQTNTTTFTLEAIKSWPISNYELDEDDENYTFDFDRMVLLKNLNLNESYLLASKHIKKRLDSGTEALKRLECSLTIVDSEGFLDNRTLIYANSDSNESNSVTKAIRPVITLSNEVEFSGEGTTENPYEIINTSKEEN